MTRVCTGAGTASMVALVDEAFPLKRSENNAMRSPAALASVRARVGWLVTEDRAALD
jgi:hypothetical protein